MRIMYLRLEDGQKLDGWIKSKSLSDSSVKDFINANLRELFDDEIVLDMESKLSGQKVKRLLLEEDIGFTMWDTGSRGNHFHIIVQGLDKVSHDERILYREHWIRKYKADMAKKNGFIAMEHKPHLKTGEYKRKIYSNEKQNKIDLKLLQSIKKKLSMKRALSRPSQPPKFDRGDIKEIKDKVKPTMLWNKWGLTKKGNRWDTPFAVSKSKSCVWLQDDKNFWYDFNTAQGGDVITAVQMKYGCSFPEALHRLRTGDY